MESDSRSEALRTQLHEIERGERASWVVYPPTPAWWPVGFGLWAATLALVIGLLDGALQALAEGALIAVMGLAMGWDRRRRGTYPSGRPPRELYRPILTLVLGAAAVASLAWLVGARLDVWVAAVVAGVGCWGLVAWYEREYAAVAALLRQRTS